MNAHDDIISDLIGEVLSELGTVAIPPGVTERIIERMRYRWGGREIYIKIKDSDSRASSVRSEYNGKNRLELQEKYHLSRAHFYKIIKGG